MRRGRFIVVLGCLTWWAYLPGTSALAVTRADELPSGIARGIVLTRYGSAELGLIAAWEILLAAGYTAEDTSFLRPALMTFIRPGFSTDRGRAMQTSQQARLLLPVLDLFIRAAPATAGSPRFVADLNELIVEVLSRYLNQLELKCAHALAEKEKNGFHKWSTRYLQVAADFRKVISFCPEKAGLMAGLAVNQQQWTVLIAYAANCLERHQKFSAQQIAGRLQALPGAGQGQEAAATTRSLVSTAPGLAGRIISLCTQVYQRNLDADIGFE